MPSPFYPTRSTSGMEDIATPLPRPSVPRSDHESIRVQSALRSFRPSRR